MAKKTLEYYVNLPYRVDIYPEEDGNGYTAIIPDLPGCMTCADTIEELWDMIQEAKELWLEVALEDGDYIPEPTPVQIEEYKGVDITFTCPNCGVGIDLKEVIQNVQCSI